MGSALRILTLTLLLALIFRKRCRIGPHVASFPSCVGCPGHPYFRAGVTFAELLAINLGREEPHLPHRLEVVWLGEREQRPGVLVGRERVACPCLLPPEICTCV